MKHIKDKGIEIVVAEPTVDEDKFFNTSIIHNIIN